MTGEGAGTREAGEAAAGGELKAQAKEERSNAITAAKDLFSRAALLMGAMFLLLLIAICLLQWSHVTSSVGGAAMVHPVAGEDSSSPTLIGWPVSSLGWAAAVAFLGFAAALAVVAIAVAASLSRIANGDN